MTVTAMSDWAPETAAQFAQHLAAFTDALGIIPSASVPDPGDG